MSNYLAGFPSHFEKGIFWLVWLGISIDVTEFAMEPNINPRVFPCVMFLRIVLDALANPGFDRIGDFSTPRLRIVDPCSLIEPLIENYTFGRLVDDNFMIYND
jgi:hypothetical protein